MTIIFIVRNSDSVYIMIINLYRFRFDRENVDWTPNIVYLFCTEILEEIDYPEDCSEENDSPMDRLRPEGINLFGIYLDLDCNPDISSTLDR